MVLDRRGFTLGEVLASLIALGIIALTVQSLMLVASNFLSQQSSSMSSMEERIFFSKLICHKFRRPVFVEQNPSRSFDYSTGTGASYIKQKNLRPTDPATLSVPLLGKSDSIGSLVPTSPPPAIVNTHHPAVQAFLSAELMPIPTDKDDHSKVLRAHINDKAATFSNIDGASGSHNYHSQFYDIYADDHTLPTYMVKQGEDDGIKLGKVSEGFIYASRCIKNHVDKGVPGSFIDIEGDSPKYSIIDRADGDMSEGEVLATALYVLEQKWRPFYFPEQKKTKNKVICCDISQFDTTTSITLGAGTPPSIPGNCANLEKYTPIIYVIKISSDGGNLENLIPGNNSLEGYVQNNASGFVNNADCKSTPPGKVDLSSACEDVVSSRYFRTLGKRLVHPVKFENVAELPLVKKDRLNSWAYGFIAPSFGGQGMHKEFKILSIENKCHTSMPVGLCGKAVPGLDLSLTANKIEGKSVAEYFISRVSHCPFHYVTMDNSGGALPLGLDRIE